MQRIFLVALAMLCMPADLLMSQTTFDESASIWGVSNNRDKDGGIAFGDFDRDGDDDVLVNTSSTSSSNGYTRLYRNDGTHFTDVTDALAEELEDEVRDRQALFADFNNDGYLDILRSLGASGSGSDRLQLFLFNNNTGGPYNNTFGDGFGDDDPIGIGEGGGVDISVDDANFEGVNAFDMDGDGDLDILIENHSYGIDILRNNLIDHITGNKTVVTPSTHFTHITPGSGTSLGLQQSGGGLEGDYSAVGDLDNDGWVDLVARKRNGNDVYFSTGNGFTGGIDLQNANNNDKGGIGLYDLDNDGDLDIVWTSDPGNYIYRNNGDRTFTLMNNALGGTFQGNGGVDGVAGGDVDNDGDIDLFFTDNNGSVLFINNLLGPGPNSAFSFTDHNFVNSGTNTHNGEGVAMADVDGDGDLDIFEIKDGNDNPSRNDRLWINRLYDGATPQGAKAYLTVDVKEIRTHRMSGGLDRPANGAMVVLKDCNGNILSGVRMVDGGSGHGSQNSQRLHFGLPNGPNHLYTVEVRYPNEQTYPGLVQPVVSKAINPALAGTNHLEVLPHEPNVACDGYLDNDRDGIINLTDLDDDNDGILDVEEVCGAGAVDYSCLSTLIFDSGNNAVNPSGDLDGDGVPNALDSRDPNFTNTCADLNLDGRCDALDARLDADGDGIPNFFDLDTDGDGLTDLLEAGGLDSLGAGTVMGNFVDNNGNGLHDTYDANNGGFSLALTDTDQDNIPDFLDLDSDNDGIADVLESNGTDADGDGRVDGTADADRDGLMDAVDADTNNDGIVDNAAGVLLRTGLDSNNDGAPDAWPFSDNDQDFLPAFRDLDSDNDGLADLAEAGGVDTNGDGRVDLFADADEDGLADTYDLDQGGNPLQNPDQDGDLIPDSRDLDSDNDGLADILEAGGEDINNDGMIDGLFADADADGFSDLVDGDADNDGTSENTASVLVLTQSDVNNDGRPEGYVSGDFDLDGILNSADLDSDNDGILDARENEFDDGDFNGAVDGAPTAGAKANGWSNLFDGLAGGNTPARPNTDGDALPNFLDIDSDGDGIVDLVEGQSTAGFVAPQRVDSDRDGIDNAFDNDNAAFAGGANNGITPVNTDGPGSYPDFIDTDSDNDNIPDAVEAWDANGDGVISGSEPQVVSPADADNDGLDDVFDQINRNGNPGFNPLNNSNPIGFPDNQAPGGDRDWRDSGPITPLPLVWGDFEAVWSGMDAQLNWSTLTEINTSHFEIQHSSDMVHWQVIGETDAAGYSATTLSYAFTHKNPGTGVHYYRLRQIDFDGAFDFSEIRSLSSDENSGAQWWLVYPNPVKSVVQINDFSGTYKVVDLSGKVIKIGQTGQSLNLSDLSKGVYILELEQNGLVQYSRILKN